ncbi:PEGA domain-containing protein [bacterium SCSIO 12696]|nr:PEGA domain-containing protein [bacterium SCSIO 12696]
MADNPSPHTSQQTIAPTEFTPLDGPIVRRKRVHPVAIAIAVALLVAGVALWFLLTARAVFFDTEPGGVEVEIDASLLFQVSDSYLIRPGTYPVRATAEGYFPLEQDIEVTGDDNQRFALVLEKKPGHLQLNSQPQGATITLNGEPAGTTPALLSDLPAGEHQIQLEAPRHFARSLTVDITGLDKTQDLQAQLDPAWGDLQITSEPAGADVFVSGEKRGVTPLSTELLTWGEEVKLQLPGHKSWHKKLQVEAGEVLAVDTVQLDKVDGLLRLSSSPAGATVTVNGTFRGQTPLELELQPDAKHNLSLFLEGYLTSRRSVTIPSGNEKRLSVSLKPETGTLQVSTTPGDAQVYINGKLRGKGGDSFPLPAKPHRIEVRRKGYASQTRSFTPRPGIEQLMQFKLLTETEARWAATPTEIKTDLGQTLKLFRPEGLLAMGASRREPGRRANEVQRQVILKRPFYLATHEVTNKDFMAFDSSHFSRQTGGVTLSSTKQPVVNVSWEQAALYCNWLSAKQGLPLFYQTKDNKVTGINPKATGYRLPTEAEWAWVARHTGNYPLKYSWGNTYPPAGGSGNFADNSAAKIVASVVKGYNDSHPVTAPIGRFSANHNGIYDLSGNAAEWVNDYYGIEISLGGKKVVDPTGPESGEFHVIRGSSWRHSSITELRLSFRDYGNEPRDDVGFRIARYVE